MPLTPDEQREKWRNLKRNQRAKNRAAAAAAGEATVDKSVDKPKASSASNPPLLEKTVREAVALMKQITDSDIALVELAYATARNIDRLVSTNDLTWTARINSGHQTLVRILHELGGTPTARQQYEFRSKKVTTDADPKATSDADNNPKGAIVSPISRRPEKRRRRVGR